FEAPTDAGANNVYDIVVHANDGTLDTTRNVAITVTDLAPVAADDIVRTNFDGNSFNVPEWAFLANDADPDGYTLDISGVSNDSSLDNLDHTAGSGSNGFITIEDGNSANGGSFDYAATTGNATDTAHVT